MLIESSATLHLASGLAVGMSGLTAGWAVGVMGESCVRAFLHQPKMFVGMILMLIFAEVIGLYGLIIALIMNTKATGLTCT